MKLKVMVDDAEPCPTLTTHTEVAESDVVEEEPDQIMEELKQSINEIEKAMNKD